MDEGGELTYAASRRIDAAGVLDSEVEVEGVLAPLREALRAGVSLAVLRVRAFSSATSHSPSNSCALKEPRS